MSCLVIAEKPLVAVSLAKVINASQRKDGYLEGNGWIVSWCIGHLVELDPPESYDERYGKWRLEDLPIIPEKWKYAVSPATGKQFAVLKQLMNRSDVDRICCATDAGREGELIFRLVYNQAGCKKPFERLWISSMEDSAIREGFANLRPSHEFDALYEAALCRERADWIIGMNATRLFSCLYGQTLAVGRVMTPTLAMVGCGMLPSLLLSRSLFIRYSSGWMALQLPAGNSRIKKRQKSCRAGVNRRAGQRSSVQSGRRKRRMLRLFTILQACREMPTVSWDSLRSRPWIIPRVCMKRNLSLIPEQTAGI